MQLCHFSSSSSAIFLTRPKRCPRSKTDFYSEHQVDLLYSFLYQANWAIFWLCLFYKVRHVGYRRKEISQRALPKVTDRRIGWPFLLHTQWNVVKCYKPFLPEKLSLQAVPGKAISNSESGRCEVCVCRGVRSVYVEEAPLPACLIFSPSRFSSFPQQETTSSGSSHPGLLPVSQSPPLPGSQLVTAELLAELRLCIWCPTPDLHPCRPLWTWPVAYIANLPLRRCEASAQSFHDQNNNVHHTQSSCCGTVG